MMFQLLLQLAHWLYSVLVVVHEWIRSPNVALLELVRAFFMPQQQRSPSASEILSSSRCLLKRPQHIALVVAEPFRHPRSKYISIYDVEGRIKKKHVELKQLVREAEMRLSDQPELIHWRVNSRRTQQLDDGDYSAASEISLHRNGSASAAKVTEISLLSLEDGKGDLVQAARTIASQVSNGELDVNSIDENLVGKSLTTNKDLPDPELLIRLGDVDSTLGFLPWQIRLTEIHSFPSWRRASFKDFLAVLKAYSKCEQRFGKNIAVAILEMASTLEGLVGRMVSIITSDSRNFVGTLKGFDQTINVILEDTHERVYSGQGVKQVVLGLHIVRGDNIAVIGELEEGALK